MGAVMGFLDTLRQAVRGHPSGWARGAAERLSLKVMRSYEEGRFGEATEAARQLLDLQREELGEDHRDYATALSNLALLLQRQGDLAGAEPLLRQVVATRKRALGESHPDYATSLNNLGELLSLRDDLEAAESLLRQALAIREDVLGESHPDYANSLNSLALLRNRRGDREGAEALLCQALEIWRQMLGEYHPDYAAGLGNLANLLIERGELTRAEVLLRQSLDIRRAALGEHHPDCLATLSHLARLLQRRAERSRSEEPSQEAPITGADTATPPADSARVPEDGFASAAGFPSDQDLRWDSVRCTEELTELTALFREVGRQVRVAGRQMQTAGRFPDASVFRALAACHSRLAVLCTEVGRLAAASGISDPPGAPAVGLRELGTQLAAVTRAEADRARAQALSVLERVLGLQTREPDDRVALEQAQARARELHQILAASPASEAPPVVEQLARGEHPFACLLALVADAEADDARRADLRRSVGWAFGPSLAECAAQAQLFLAQDPGTPAVTAAGDCDDG
jgi:tetratricopeptide (TPR) repeat protein